MSTPIPLHRPLTALAAATLIFVGLCSSSRAIDDNATKQIWKLKYGVSDTQLADNVWLSQDSDGDGLKNGDEIGAGTNPFLGSSTVKVSSFVKNGANVELQFPTQPGKRYRVESTATLGGTWTLQPQPTPVEVIGDGTTKMLSVAYAANKFYRVRVDDVDTDGEGVGNWAELAVTLDTGDTETVNGTNDLDLRQRADRPAQRGLHHGDGAVRHRRWTGSGQAHGDPHAESVPDPRAPERDGHSRRQSVGADYTALPASVPFAARGATKVDLMVDPIVPQAAVNGSKSVTAAIVPPGTVEFPYAVGAPSSATVIIKDSTVPTGTGLRARYYDTSSATYANSANFNAAQIKFDRVDPVVDNEWLGGTANGNTIAPNNSPDNYSSTWEGYLNPTTAGDYQFQLDADDKARVLLDLNGNGTFELPGEQIVEHGWDAAATVGTFNVSGTHTLAVPANPAQRYKIRVEHVETTGAARCRLQWRRGTNAFALIPTANAYSHVSPMSANYSYTRTDSTPGAMAGNIVVTLTGHTFAPTDPVKLSFSSGVLFTPTNGNFHGTFTVASVAGDTFTVPITAATLPATGTNGAGYVLDQPGSTSQNWYNLVYATTDFTGAPGRVGLDNNGGPTNREGGLYGTGTPDIATMQVDTFSIRWTGQMQPQFTEEYTIAVHADDGCRLWINGQEQDLRQTCRSTWALPLTPMTTSPVTWWSPSPVEHRGRFLWGGRRGPAGSDERVLSRAREPWIIRSRRYRQHFHGQFRRRSFATGAGNMNIDGLNKAIKPGPPTAMSATSASR